MCSWLALFCMLLKVSFLLLLPVKSADGQTFSASVVGAMPHVHLASDGFDTHDVQAIKLHAWQVIPTVPNYSFQGFSALVCVRYGEHSTLTVISAGLTMPVVTRFRLWMRTFQALRKH